MVLSLKTKIELLKKINHPLIHKSFRHTEKPNHNSVSRRPVFFFPKIVQLRIRLSSTLGDQPILIVAVVERRHGSHDMCWYAPWDWSTVTTE
jgi:hypothetical protein